MTIVHINYVINSYFLICIIYLSCSVISMSTFLQCTEYQFSLRKWHMQCSMHTLNWVREKGSFSWEDNFLRWQKGQIAPSWAYCEKTSWWKQNKIRLKYCDQCLFLQLMLSASILKSIFEFRTWITNVPRMSWFDSCK